MMDFGIDELEVLGYGFIDAGIIVTAGQRIAYFQVLIPHMPWPVIAATVFAANLVAGVRQSIRRRPLGIDIDAVQNNVLDRAIPSRDIHDSSLERAVCAGLPPQPRDLIAAAIPTIMRKTSALRRMAVPPGHTFIVERHMSRTDPRHLIVRRGRVIDRPPSRGQGAGDVTAENRVWRIIGSLSRIICIRFREIALVAFNRDRVSPGRPGWDEIVAMNGAFGCKTMSNIADQAIDRIVLPASHKKGLARFENLDRVPYGFERMIDIRPGVLVVAGRNRLAVGVNSMYAARGT